MDERVCQGQRKDGTPCRARALPGSDYCFAHDPTLQEKRHAAYAAGGRGSSNAARVQRLVPRDLKPVLATLMTALDETHAGTLTPQQASAMAALAGAIGRLFGVAELQARVEALERAGGNEHAS